MPIYLDVVFLINFFVDFLLLLGTDRMCGYLPQYKRGMLAALLGGTYGSVCVLPTFYFLGHIYWRVVCLLLMGWIAFGGRAFRRIIVFVFLSMALGGIATAFSDKNMSSLLVSALLLCSLCFVGFRGKICQATYIPVVIHNGVENIHIIALQDTGNLLTDPITGKPVLLVSSEIAKQLVGIDEKRLSTPVETLAKAQIPGLRLIPYHSVGNPVGMLLAIRMKSVQIGKWKGSTLVAFAPQVLNAEGRYQALLGGAV